MPKKQTQCQPSAEYLHTGKIMPKSNPIQNKKWEISSVITVTYGTPMDSAPNLQKPYIRGSRSLSQRSGIPTMY
jgi:hypothetical protein